MDPFEQQRKLQGAKAEERVTPYQRLYGLKENPFPSLALFSPSMDDPRRNGDIYDQEFRLDEERRFFEMFVQRPTGDKPLEIGFVRLDPQAGGRGNGKSVFLNRLMERVNGQDWSDFKADFDDPALYALAIHLLPEPRKQKRFWQFALLIFETLKEKSLFERIDADLRAAMAFQLLSDAQKGELANQATDQRAQAWKSDAAFRQLLNAFGISDAEYRNAVEEQVRAASGRTLSADFLSDFLNAGASLSTLWAKWEKTGQAGNAYRWRNNGADWLLNGLVPVLIATGYQHLYVLLDEFEKIYIYQSSREREEFLDALRQYFFERDSAAVRRQYISVVLTTHPSIDRYLGPVWARVGLDNLAPLAPGRMQYQAIELGASDIPKLTHLLITYLDKYRLNGQHTGTLYPFAIGALDPAMEAARLYPRGTLWFAHNILNQAASASVAAPIQREFIDEFLASGQQPPADEDDDIFRLPSSESNLTA